MWAKDPDLGEEPEECVGMVLAERQALVQAARGEWTENGPPERELGDEGLAPSMGDGP